MKKIYRVSFAVPVDGVSDFYFASLAAIFERFSVDDIGCGLSNLWRGTVAPGKPYQNKKCKISEEVLFVKPTQRKGGFK